MSKYVAKTKIEKKNLVEITCQQKQNQFSSRFQVYPKHYFLGIRSVTINTYIQAS